MGGPVRYSQSAMSEAERNFTVAAQKLEATIASRREDVAVAMASYEATGVSEDYAAKEARWTQSADQVVEIIGTLRRGMNQVDGHATDANARLRALGEGL